MSIKVWCWVLENGIEIGPSILFDDHIELIQRAARIAAIWKIMDFKFSIVFTTNEGNVFIKELLPGKPLKPVFDKIKEIEKDYKSIVFRICGVRRKTKRF